MVRLLILRDTRLLLEARLILAILEAVVFMQKDIRRLLVMIQMMLAELTLRADKLLLPGWPLTPKAYKLPHLAQLLTQRGRKLKLLTSQRMQKVIRPLRAVMVLIQKGKIPLR